MAFFEYQIFKLVVHSPLPTKQFFLSLFLSQLLKQLLSRHVEKFHELRSGEVIEGANHLIYPV